MAEEYRFTLEKYKTPSSRHTCPVCNNKRCFTYYIDTHTGQILDEKVGRCNREDKCSYHYTPKEYFADNPLKRIRNESSERSFITISTKRIIPKVQAPIEKTSFIPKEVFIKSLQHYSRNKFTVWLSSLFGYKITDRLIRQFCIGTSKYWPGATVFWQIDSHLQIRTGKVMLYNNQTGKRIKEPSNHIHWVHSMINKSDYQLCQCLFGEHQLHGKTKMKVGIVESEKTAIIASVYIPEYVWLATGSSANLNKINPKVLSGHKITLFPDLKVYDRWNGFAKSLAASCKIKVSDLLENNATAEQRTNGLDLADYLIKRDKDFGWALSDDGYPLFWDE